MDKTYLLGLTFAGVCSGSLAGLIGGGAEIVIVPLLTLFGIFKYNQTPNLYGILGLMLIISGVIILNTFGKVK